MSAAYEGRALLPDNAEELTRDYLPAWARAIEEPPIQEEEEEEPLVIEEISATLSKTAYGDYVAQVPIAEGQFATIGVQSTSKKAAFDQARDSRDAIHARGALTGDLILRIILCIVLIIVIGVAASIVGTAILNDITLKEALSVFLQGFS